jgi:hypothetical protein
VPVSLPTELEFSIYKSPDGSLQVMSLTNSTWSFEAEYVED